MRWNLLLKGANYDLLAMDVDYYGCKFAHSYFSEELQAPDQRGTFASTIVGLKK